jgi:hypothetical protein
MGLWIAAGVLIALWAAFLFFMTRTHPLLRGAALVATILAFVAIGTQNRALLWTGVVAMTAIGVVAARVCGKTGCEVRPENLDIHPGKRA